MTQFLEKIKRGIMYISFQERRKRELECHEKEREMYRRMGEHELEYEYINLKSIYEHKKGVLMAFLVSILISVLMSFWTFFAECMGKITQYLALSQGMGMETAKAGFIVCVILLVSLTVVVLGVLFRYMRSLHQIYRKLLVIEAVQKELAEHKGAETKR